MFTTLVLGLASTLQGGAALHSADTGVFIEVPDVPGFVKAWQASAIPSILGDDALAEVLELSGLSTPLDLEALTQSVFTGPLQQLLPILEGVQGLSLSAQVDLDTLEAVVQEMVVAHQVFEELAGLNAQISAAFDPEQGPPKDLASLGLPVASLLDPFGNPFVYTVTGQDFRLMSLGADGALGGQGNASDWTLENRFAPYLVAQLARIAGLELVVEWASPEVAGHVAAMAGLQMDKLAAELPVATVTELGNQAGFPSRSFSVQPSDVGVAGVAEPLEFGLISSPHRSIVTIGRLKAADALERVAAFEAGELAPGCLARDETFMRSIRRVHRAGGAVLWQGAIRGFGGLTEGDSIGDALGKLGTFFGLLGFESGAWQTRLVDGVYITDAVSVGAQGAGDLNRVSAVVPDDAVLLSVSKVDPLGIWDFIDGVVTIDDDSGELDDLMASIEPTIKDDLMANLGHQYALWFQPVSGLAPPSAFFVTPVRDGEQVMAALDQLADRIALVDEDFRVSRRPYKGINYTTLDVGIPIGFRPSFAVIDDMLWVSNSSTLLKRTIRQRSKGDMGARGAHPLLVSLRDESGALPANLESAFFADIGSMIAAYYGAGRSFAGMITLDVGVPPGLIDALPAPDIFTRHIHPASSWTVYEDGALLTHKEGAFGPEPLLLVAGVIPLVASRTDVEEPHVVSIELTLPPSSLDHEVAQAQAALETIGLGLLVYSIENDDYPERLEELLVATKAYPQGCLGIETLPLDSWGHAFVYKRQSAKQFRLYSLGPDGVDQAGGGDDILGQ